jgi:hypothetical protein
MTNHLSNAKEALLVELLKDIDEMVKRLEAVDSKLAATIETATKEATGKAFLMAQLNFKSLMEEQENKLISTAKYATSLIGNQLHQGTIEFITNHEQLNKKLKWVYFWIVLIAFIAGMAGGYIGFKLARIL